MVMSSMAGKKVRAGVAAVLAGLMVGWAAVPAAPARSPSPRTGAALVYDAATAQLLLFGGSRLIGTGGGFYGGTWVWTGSTWHLPHPVTSPPVYPATVAFGSSRDLK